MKVQDRMTTPVATCTPESNLAEVAMEMWRNDCGAVPVIDAEGRAIGMITDRDICIAAATRHHDIAEITVGSVTSRPVASCRPDDELVDVLSRMGEQQVRRLPVVGEDGRLQGIISINDLILCAERTASDNHHGISTDALLESLKRISAHWLPVATGTGEPTNRKPRKRRAGSIAG